MVGEIVGDLLKDHVWRMQELNIKAKVLKD